MTQKEQARLQVLNSLLAEHMTLDQAATLMGVTTRHTRRILAAYREKGEASLAHGHRGRRPANATPDAVVAGVVRLARTRYAGGQPHPSQRVAQRARRHRHWQDHPAAHPGQRRAEQFTAKASAQAPGTPPAHAPGGHADTDGRQSSPVVGEPGTTVHAADCGGRCHRYGGCRPLLRAGRQSQLLPADPRSGAALRPYPSPPTSTATPSSGTRLAPASRGCRPSSAGPWENWESR